MYSVRLCIVIACNIQIDSKLHVEADWLSFSLAPIDFVCNDSISRLGNEMFVHNTVL